MRRLKRCGQRLRSLVAARTKPDAAARLKAVNIAKFSRHATGFTLIELMVVVALVGVLSTLAISGFSASFKRDQQFSRSWQELKAFYRAARGEALRRGTHVSITSSSNTLIAFIDLDGDNSCAPSAADLVLATFPDSNKGQAKLGAGQTVTMSSHCSAATGTNFMGFSSMGTAISDTGQLIATNAFFQLADTTTGTVKRCQVSMPGGFICTE